MRMNSNEVLPSWFSRPMPSITPPSADVQCSSTPGAFHEPVIQTGKFTAAMSTSSVIAFMHERVRPGRRSVLYVSDKRVVHLVALACELRRRRASEFVEIANAVRVVEVLV